MIPPLGVGILPQFTGAYAAETAKIPGNATRSSLFYIVQKFPLTFLLRSPPLGLTLDRPAGASETSRRRLPPPAGSLPIRLGDTLAWPSPLPPFGEDVPVPGARAALLLLGQGQKLKAGEQR